MNKVVVHSHKSRHQIEYDDNGNQEKMTDDTGETVRTYDELNRVISKNVGNISGEALYKYDILVFEGNDYLTAEVSVDNKGNEITKVYDKAGRLKYVVDDELVSGSSISSADSTKLTEYNYYDNGARESIRHPQFTEGSNTYRYRQTYNYRNDGLLNILITHKMEITANGENVNSQLERFQYYYDNAGNQTSKFEIVDGVVKGTTDFEYDDLNRLEKVTEPEGRETVYTFDAAGNRKTEAITESGATVNKIYHYNDKNWLEEVEVLGAETIEYDYDEDGNQTEVRKVENGVTEVRAEYKYDPLNRLIEAVTDTATVTYAYNGEGRRVEKSTGQETIYYLYEYDKVVLEVDGTGDQVARNLYGINLLMRDVDEDSYYYVYNGHADVTALIDANTGVVEATYYYDPFGNILESTGSVNNNITYAGYQYDEETELYYLNARMYDPKVARFLQEDTYRGDPNDPLSLNLYAYSVNNPITYYDPTGYVPEHRQGMPTDLWNIVNPTLREPNIADKIFLEFLKYSGKAITSTGEIASDVWQGFVIRGKKQFDSPYDFVNCATMGITGGFWEGCKERGEKAFDSPYDFLNALTIGIPDTVTGALNPDEPCSKEHILSSFGLATLIYGGYKTVNNKNSLIVDPRKKSTTTNNNIQINLNIQQFDPNGVISLNSYTVVQIPSLAELGGSLAGTQSVTSAVMFASVMDGSSFGGGSNFDDKGAGKAPVQTKDLKRLPDNKVKDLGGEGYTQPTKAKTGKSKADLYWDPKTGDVYSIPKSGGTPEYVDTIPTGR